MFKCTKCGICCRNIDKIPELSMYDDGMGTCIKLKGNICSIYEDRPDICRVDEMYEKVYHQFYTVEEYYKMNEIVCKELQRSYIEAE